jgi:hypothetical protein
MKIKLDGDWIKEVQNGIKHNLSRFTKLLYISTYIQRHQVLPKILAGQKFEVFIENYTSY